MKSCSINCVCACGVASSLLERNDQISECVFRIIQMLWLIRCHSKLNNNVATITFCDMDGRRMIAFRFKNNFTVKCYRSRQVQSNDVRQEFVPFISPREGIDGPPPTSSRIAWRIALLTAAKRNKSINFTSRTTHLILHLKWKWIDFRSFSSITPFQYGECVWVLSAVIEIPTYFNHLTNALWRKLKHSIQSE